MATTTNFGWETPDDTDLVKDGAAAMRTLGNAIDTSLVDLKGGTTGQVLSKASNTDLDFSWTSVDPLTILDSKGDLITATAADTPARLAVGSNGQFLKANSSTSTGLEWANPSATKNYSLLNSGGTALTGAQDITISGISAQDSLMILVIGASSASASSSIGIRLNSDTGNNYSRAEARVNGYQTWESSAVDSAGTATTSWFNIGTLASNASATANGYCKIDGAATSGLKVAVYGGGGSYGGSGIYDQVNYHGGGVWNGSAVTSITVRSFTGNFDAGTVYVYGAA